MEVVKYDSKLASAWDTFISRHPCATFYHQSAWQYLVSSVYGLKAHYMACVNQGNIVGIAPLFEMRNLSFQRVLISLPFSNYGGILALSSDVKAMLLQEIRRRKQSCRAKYVLLKKQDCLCDEGEDIVIDNSYCSPQIELVDREEDMFRQLPGKTRNQVRKAIKCGASADIDSEKSRLDFLSLYYENMKRLGTPCHRRAWFDGMSEIFGERCVYVVIRVGDCVVSAGMMLIFHKRLILQHAVSSMEARSTCGNVFLYWSVIAEAIRRGIKCVDCGRSRIGSTNERFKMQWCASRLETPYAYVTKGEIPDEHPANSKFERVITCWKKMPIFMTKIIGPLLRKHITT